MELTELDQHVLKVALMALCAREEAEGASDEFKENVRHAARAIGVYDDLLETAISLWSG